MGCRRDSQLGLTSFLTEVRIAYLLLRFVLIGLIAPSTAHAVDVDRACMLDFSFVREGLTGKDYIEFLEGWGLTREEAAAILLDERGATRFAQILPGGTLHRAYAKDPNDNRLALFATARLERGIEAAPPGFAEEMGITKDVDIFYTRWKMLESTGVENLTHRYYMARAMMDEPLVQPRSLKMTRKDFRDAAKLVVRKGEIDQIDVDLLFLRMPHVQSLMKFKPPPKSASKKREYLLEFLIEDALTFQKMVQEKRGGEISTAEYISNTRQSFQEAGFPEPMVNQLVAATAHVFLGIPPAGPSAHKRILARIRSMVRDEFNTLRDYARALLRAEASQNQTAEAAEAGRDNIPATGAKSLAALETTPEAKPTMPNPKKRKNQRREAMAPRIRADRSPGSVVPKARRRKPEQPKQTPQDDTDVSRQVARTTRAEPHPREPIQRKSIIIDTNILMGLQFRREGLMDDNRAYMLSNFSSIIGSYDFESGGRLFLPDRVIREGRDDMTAVGNYRKLKPTLRRSSAKYKAVMAKLEEKRVGIPKGESEGGIADRQIVADILFAERANPDVVPTFYTADSNIFGRMCSLSPECVGAGRGRDFFRNLRSGYVVRFSLSDTESIAIRIVPVPSGRDVLSSSPQLPSPF